MSTLRRAVRQLLRSLPFAVLAQKISTEDGRRMVTGGTSVNPTSDYADSTDLERDPQVGGGRV